MPTSRLPGFYKLSPDARLSALEAAGAITRADAALYANGGLARDAADQMVENVVGTFELPNAVAVNLCIDGEDRLVPMVVEEPSVVAAVSNMARLTRKAGGLVTQTDASVMIGQIQLIDVQDPAATEAALRAELPRLIALADAVHPRLKARGGGVRDLHLRRLTYDEPGYPVEHMVVLHVLIDCVDAMGANLVNTVCERLAPHVEQITDGTVGLRILSNLASHRLARASCRIPVSQLAPTAEEAACVAEGIASAWRFAWADPWRAATHNKGVMNGIDAVALATGNDWRAIEAGAHAWASRTGQYRPMTTWRVHDGHLTGTLELPMQFGTVGGPIKLHPKAQANLRLMGCRGARDLAGVAASVGLVQNLGALRALATEGIQAGHMRMHARTVSIAAGATPAEVPKVVARLCAAKDWSVEHARVVVADLRG